MKLRPSITICPKQDRFVSQVCSPPRRISIFGLTIRRPIKSFDLTIFSPTAKIPINVILNICNTIKIFQDLQSPKPGYLAPFATPTCTFMSASALISALKWYHHDELAAN